MATSKFATALLIGVGIGFSVAYPYGSGSRQGGSSPAVEARAPIAQRLGELETAFALERYARKALADEIARVSGAMEAPTARATGDDDESRSKSRPTFAVSNHERSRSATVVSGSRELFPGNIPGNLETLDQYLHQQQFDRLVAAGLSPGRAQTIMQREHDIEMDVLRAQHTAEQSGATPQEVARITPLGLLRSELGDTEYAQYLDARGRPTSISVREVLKSSPGEISGLISGDEIIAYNGQRVFDVNELTALTYEAQKGTTVPLLLFRNGQPIQIYVDAGPIGISDDRRP